jgi:hypothetical protein
MAYGLVMDKLVNSIDVNDVKNKLQNEFNDIPYIKRLNSYIMNQENAEELYSQIYTSIGNKIRVTYETVIKDRTSKIYGSLSNRQSYEFIISEKLNSDVKNNVKHTPGSILDILNLYEKDITSILLNETALQNIKELIAVYNKGLAAWRGGAHRPGASQQSWAVARVNSFLTCGKTFYFPDHLLAKEAMEKSPKAKEFWSGQRCKFSKMGKSL